MLDRLLPSMLEAIPDYALVLNGTRQVVAANRRLIEAFGIAEIEALLGRRPGEAMGCLFAGFGPDGCGTDKHCSTCGTTIAVMESLQSDSQAVHECRLTRPWEQGPPFELEVTATPLEIDDIPLIFCIFKDISAAKRRTVLEKVFFHDVINTAGGIRGIAAQLMEGNWEEPGQEAAYKQWMVELSDRLIEEIGNQRKLLAAENGEFKPDLGLVSVSELLRGVHALYASHDIAEGRRLVLGRTPDSTILSDASILRRILGNLVKNALEATERGETVTLWGAESADGVIFSVHNPGVMPEEVQLQLFQRSFSTKSDEGRGIGTYSVKLFGERYLKGKVSFVSRAPEGTTFRYSVPNIFPKLS
ncbi:MAG TPA: ATP-binding protein [Geobacteraceae bacterium]